MALRQSYKVCLEVWCLFVCIDCANEEKKGFKTEKFITLRPLAAIWYHAAFSKPLPNIPIDGNLVSRSRDDCPVKAVPIRFQAQNPPDLTPKISKSCYDKSFVPLAIQCSGFLWFVKSRSRGLSFGNRHFRRLWTFLVGKVTPFLLDCIRCRTGVVKKFRPRLRESHIGW